MSKRTKRRLEDFDPNASDPEDEDYNVVSSPRPQRSRAKHSSTTKRKPKKRARRSSYGDSDDVIDSEEDSGSEESFASEEDEEDEDVPLNRAGRPTRRATQKETKYEEPSEDDIDDLQLDEDVPRSRRAKTPRKSLVVKLRFKKDSPRTARATRAQSAGKTTKRGPTPEVMGTRRSSRLSHDQEDPIVALTDSGKHVQIVRPGTRSPEAPPRRSIGGKAPKKLPSAIMEASQEGSGAFAEPQHSLVKTEDDNAEVQDSRAGTPSDSEIRADAQMDEDTQMGEGIVEESVHDEEEESDEGPVTRGKRNLRPRAPASEQGHTGVSQRRRKGLEESSDFEPTVEDEREDEDMSGSDGSKGKRIRQQSTESGGRRSRRLAHGRQTRNSQRSRSARSDSGHDSEIDLTELAEEAEELVEQNSKRRRTRRGDAQAIAFDQPKLRSRTSKVDYRILRPELTLNLDDDEAAPAVTPVRNKRGGGGAYRSLFSIQGPFGGAVGPPPVVGAPGAAGGADSDSSDDDMVQQVPRGVGGMVGMTPTSAAPKNLFPQAHGHDAATASGGGPANFGKVKDQKALADADPLGVDPSVSFDGVGGLDSHINQLKEMVMLPLLYPEVFVRFHVTPPRGVLFHGPPGTGKTLLARALASSVSHGGKKVTFYMRKGADALSKWVGEAEKQLRLLFEEARKNQPSIIFFDEIDGLAPVRSSKQDQIHSSIVATLLALMDGMDGRGQVIVIGATNRPDSVDPALRRPGRFDREFYFPLPNLQARRAIIDIHTKGWDPPLAPTFKDQLAELTKGYGGADLRALCTEAALNAVQGTYPQIYQSTKKLLIDPAKINVLAKDFMITVNKMIPSSARAASSGAAPLDKTIEPLLRKPLQEIGKILDDILPQKKKLTALEEAHYDDREDDGGFERETMQREFERARVFRPRLLIHGLQGMGQQYLGSALLHKFENLHVQSFDLPTLLEDATRSPEAAVIQLFKEVRRHKPSVIYIPNVDLWYDTVGQSVIKTFTSLLRSLPPNDPVLVLGVQDSNSRKLDTAMLADLFGFSPKNHYALDRPDEVARKEFFETLLGFIRMQPSDFPDPENRRKRKFAELQEAPEPQISTGPTKEQLKAQKKQDRHTLNLLKIQLQPVMDQIKNKYKTFRTPIIDDGQIQYLYDEQDPDVVSTDLPPEQRQDQYRPFELSTDHKGIPGLLEATTGKFYYNLEIVMIEKRLSNGYYKRPKDFLADIKRLAKDARTSGDQQRTLKANELVSNVEVDMQYIESTQPALVAECEAVYAREQARAKEAETKAKQTAATPGAEVLPTITSNVPPHISGTTATTETTGPVVLGEPVPGPDTLPPVTPKRSVKPGPSSLSNGYHTSIGESNGRPSDGTTAGDHDDVHMTDSHDVTSALRNRPDFHTPSKANTQSSQKQYSARTVLHANSQPQDLHNSASTTTSGQKTSQDRSSGPYNNSTQNTQATNGAIGDHPGTEFFSALAPQSGGSQIPDTQEMAYASSQQSNSQPSQQSSQAFPVPPPPPRHAPSIPSILNSEAQTEQPKLIVDETLVGELHEKLVGRSSGLSVEQLEQVNATLMDCVWKSRSNWNRNLVIHKVSSAFNDIIKDIEEMQLVLQPSQPTPPR